MIKEMDYFGVLLESMEVKGVVSIDDSLPVLNKIAQQMKSLRERKAMGLANPRQIFECYYPSFVSSIVLDTIRSRLFLSKANKDNPQIAVDSLAVLPYLKEIAINLEVANNSSDFLKLASGLQEKAMNHNLFHPKTERIENLGQALKEITEEVEII